MMVKLDSTEPKMQLVIGSVHYFSRSDVETLIRFLQVQLDVLWPKEKKSGR